MSRFIVSILVALIGEVWAPAALARGAADTLCSPLPPSRFEAINDPFADPLSAAISSTSEAEPLRHAMQYENINALRGTQGTTALTHAAANDNLIAITLLLDAGADPNLPSRNGATPLEMALLYARIASACVLLRAGAQIPPPSTFAYLLPAASATEDFQAAQDTVELLITFGYDVNARVMGDTALLIAAQLGNAALVDTLLEHGADTTLTNNRGETAEAVALRFAHPAIAQRIARARAEH